MSLWQSLCQSKWVVVQLRQRKTTSCCQQTSITSERNFSPTHAQALCTGHMSSSHVTALTNCPTHPTVVETWGSSNHTLMYRLKWALGTKITGWGAELQQQLKPGRKVTLWLEFIFESQLFSIVSQLELSGFDHYQSHVLLCMTICLLGWL